MKHFYIIANLDKEYVQEAQVFIKAYLEAKEQNASCTIHLREPGGSPHRRDPGAEGYGVRHNYRRGRYPHTGCQGPGGPQHSHAGVNRGHLGYLNQVSRQEDIAPVLESLLNERYQLERRMMIHGTAWRKEETLLKDIAPSMKLPLPERIP